jgi:hypothetical protein
MSEKSNLFNRLTKLFRSGPVIKRNVRNITAQRGSTAVEVFKKAHSDVYNATLSAYGAFDRMSRYSDFAEMESCISGDTLIAVPNGYATIKELSEKYGNDEVFIVYSYDHSKQQIVPAYGKQARKTATAETIKITFDSGKTLICTPDHRVMRRDGTYCEAIELQLGDSMMPFYRRNLFSKTREENDDHYRWIYTMNREESTVKNGWIAEHKLIAEWAANRKMLPNEEVHHINFVRYDNRPENLLIMDGKEHRSYHSKFLNEKKWSEDNKEWINKFRANHSKFMQDHNPATRKDITFELILNLCDRYGFNLYDLQRRLDCSLTPIYNRLESNGFRTFEEFAKAYDPNWRNNGHNNEKENNPRYDKNLTFIDVANHYKQGITLQQLADALQTTPMKINYRLKHQGYKSWTDFKDNFANHKVVSVEKHETINLYDLTVDGYKNYATDSIIVHNTPEICSALDIYAEETVSPDEHGKVLHVYSDNRKVHELLTHLFYDVLNVEFNLVMWVRNLVKYGDFFLFNDINPEYGVINAYPISISEIEREEGYDPNDPAAVRFRWVTQGNQLLENWQISHFRLLGNDAFLPYGSSVLEGARRIWRQLILIEDAMLVYRVIRAPERRVFYIDVGNVPPEEVANYLEQVQTSLKRNQIIDRKTGKVDLRYNPLSVEEDFFLPVRGGESGTKIDTLAGGQNTAAIEDVQYIQNKLFAALKIPKAYIGYDADIGSKATLSQEDIRFSRTIQRIQKTVISELNKIAQIHLYCHGYDGEDLADFELHLSNPSTVAQMQKLELIRTRFEIAGAAPEGSVNRAWIQKNVLGLTDAEIEEVKVGRIADKKNDLELEAVTADGGDEGGDAGGGDESGGDEGGGLDDLLGGGDEEGGEDLTAGDAKSGDLILGLPISPSSSVQTKLSHNYYGEADEPIDIGSLSILDANAPLKAAAAIRRNGIEEDRNAFGEDRPKKKARRKGKRLRTAMPDLLGMVNHERSRDSLKDPFGRTTEPAKLIDENSFTPPRVTFDLVRTLSKMSNVMGIARKHNALLNESEGEGDPDGEA